MLWTWRDQSKRSQVDVAEMDGQGKQETHWMYEHIDSTIVWNISPIPQQLEALPKPAVAAFRASTDPLELFQRLGRPSSERWTGPLFHREPLA